MHELLIDTYFAIDKGQKGRIMQKRLDSVFMVTDCLEPIFFRQF